MSEWAKELLADVARETIAEADGVTAETYPNLYAKEFPKALAVLERRLLGLLEAGEVNFSKHDECEDGFYSCPKAEGYFGTDDRNHCSCGKDAWDAAKASAVRP